MKIKGNEVYWLSSKGNVAVVYTQFAMDVKYKVYRKVKYGGNHLWDYVIAFATYGEALEYAKKIHDMEVEKMIELKDLLQDDEVIINYHITTDGWYSRNAIITKGSDVSSALEDTLHRILEANGNEQDVYRIMGAKIPTESELEELEESDEFVWIDLGYVIPGLIDYWKESEGN